MGRLHVVRDGRNTHPFHLTADERSAIECEIERLIASLDLADGETDLEDDDPAGDHCDMGEPDPSRPDGIVLPLPIYGADQSAGPINGQEVHRAYHRALMGRR